MSMRILSLIPSFPYPPTDGTKIQSYHRIKHLARRNRVTVVCLQKAGVSADHLAVMNRYGPVHLIDVQIRGPRAGGLAKAVDFTRSLARRAPYYLEALKRPHAVHALEDLVSQEEFDVIEADSIAGIFLRSDWRPLKVLIKHSVTDTAVRREIRVTRQLNRKLRRFAYLPLERRLESRLCTTADLCVTLTRQCARELRRLDARIRAACILTNGVDLTYHRFGAPAKTPQGLCFVGRMDYAPNIDAVTHFHRHIFPAVKRARPDSVFWVVGSHPGSDMKSLANSSGVRITGFVEDVRPFLHRAGIAVVPTRAGGGIINKVLEPLALGVPVVASSRAIEGLGVQHERELLVADNPAAFTENILRVFDNSQLRMRLALNGRAYVEKFHDWPGIVQRYEQSLQWALRQHAADQLPIDARIPA